MRKIALSVVALLSVFALLPAAGLGQSKDDGIRLFKEALALDEKAQSHADMQRTMDKYQQALRIFERTGFKKGIGVVANNMAIIYDHLGKYDKAMELHEKALAIRRELKDRAGESKTLSNMGIVYKAWGEYDKAMELYEESLALCRELKDRAGEGQTLNNMAVVYQAWGKYDKAMKLYEKSLAICRELKHRAAEGDRLGNMAIVYEARGKYDKAMELYEQSLTIQREIRDKAGESKTLNNMAAVYKAWGKYDKAMELCEKSLAIDIELKDRAGEGNILNNMALVYRAWGNYDKAMELYEKSLAIKRELKDRAGEGNTLNNIAMIYKAWGKYDKATDLYEKSLAICRELKNRAGESQALTNMGIIYWHWREYDKAMELFEKSLAIERELKDRAGEGNTLGNMAIVYEAWGKYDKAMELYKKTLTIERVTRDRAGESKTLRNMAAVYKAWGKYDKAMELYEKSLAVDRELKHRAGVGSTLNNMATIYDYWGKYHKAMELYENSLAIRRELKDEAGEGQTLNNMAIACEAWGKYDKAMELYEKSLTICRELKDRAGEGKTVNNMANVHRAWGKYDNALELYEKSLAICRELKDRAGEARTLMNIGQVLQQRGDHDKAIEDFQQALAIRTDIKVPTEWPKALMADTYMDTGDLTKAEPLVMQSNYTTSWARFYLLKRDFPRAKEYYSEVLKSASVNRNAEDLFTAYTGIGVASEGLDDYAGAAEYYKKAVKHTEEIRSALSPAEREKFFDVKIKGFSRTAPYEGLARVLLRQDRPQEAYCITELTRARVFAEAMSSRMGEGKNLGLPREIVKQDQEITNQLANRKESLQKAYEKNNKLTIESLEPQVKELEGKLQAHIKMLRDKYPLFAATKYPQPMDLSQTALTDNEWVLTYDVTDTGVLVYLIKGKTLVKALFKAVPRKELDDLVRRFREPMEIEEITPEDLNAFDFATGKKLSDILLADILPLLPKGEQLIIVPDDSLGVLPFEMLVLNAGGKVVMEKRLPEVVGAEFFGDRNPISYYQSVTALTLARNFAKHKSAGQRLMVMDNPIFSDDDPRFRKIAHEKPIAAMSPLTKDNLLSIKKEKKMDIERLPLTATLGDFLQRTYAGKTDRYTGIKASKEVLFNTALDGYGSMVFATHGYFGKDLPGIMEPVLILSLVGQPKGQDGFLRMSEVMSRLRLNADVVALTACMTGLGQRISGEGTMGMGRAFQYAGAKSVLMSLWSVAEKSSVKLVESFFQHLKEGKTKLEALKLARDDIRKAGYDHPFFWAPFILAGEVN